MRTAYKEKLIYAGDMIFGVVHAVFPKAGRRGKRWRPTNDIQKMLNERHARERLTWLIHENFDRNSVSVTLTYDDAWYPDSEKRFEKDIRNYIAKLKRLYKKAGAEFKYIVIKAFGELGRCHLHLIMSGGVNRDGIESAWNFGRSNADRLQFNACGVIDLSVYLADQRHSGKRRWSGSKNLKQPKERTNVHRYSRRELKGIMDSSNPHKFFAVRYEGYWLSEFPRVVRNAINGSYYMTFVMYKPDSVNLEWYARRKESRNACGFDQRSAGSVKAARVEAIGRGRQDG